MVQENRDLKLDKRTLATVRRLWAGGERAQAIALAVKAKLPEKEWPEGMADHKAVLDAGH